MPLYGFKCKCGFTQDKQLKVAARDTAIYCPTCKAQMKRQISSSPFKIKGYSEQNGYSGRWD